MSEPEVDLPVEAPEADVLEQYQSSAGLDAEEEPAGTVPPEADPADVDEQRRSVDDGGEDDYR
jgi:hypothetical protein